MSRKRSPKNAQIAQNDEDSLRSDVSYCTVSFVRQVLGIQSVTSLRTSRRTQDRLDKREAAIIEDLRELEILIETQTKDVQRYTMGERDPLRNFEDISDDWFPDEEPNFPGFSNENITVNNAESNTDGAYQDRYADDDDDEYLDDDDGYQYLGVNDNYDDYPYNVNQDVGANCGEEDFKLGCVRQHRDNDVEDYPYGHQHLVAKTNDDDERKYDVLLAHRNGEISDEGYEKQPQPWDPSDDHKLRDTIHDKWGNNNDWTSWLRGIVARESDVKVDLNKEDENMINDDSPDLLNELVDLHISDSYPHNKILTNLGRHLEKQPIFKAILSSDAKAYFKQVVNSDYVENRECESCFCNVTNSDTRIKSKQDLLHIAAAISTVEFVKTMIDPALSSQAIREHGRDRANIESIEEHYQMTVEHWLRDVRHCMMTPMSLAAEFDRIDMVSMLLTYGFDSYQKDITYPLLDTLVHSRSLNRIDPELIGKIIDTASKKNLDHAIRTAVEVGDYEGMIKAIEECASVQIEEINELRNQEAAERNEKNFIPGIFSFEMQKRRAAPERSSTESHESPTYAQILAENELKEQFERMHVNEKMEMNVYGWTSLVALLNFPDEFVKRQLKCFGCVKKEDLFFFISQVIIKNRLSLLTIALQKVFSDPRNFEKIETDIYEAYSLPEYIPLPLETALSRTGDMRIVEHIAGFYMRQDNFTKSIQREDALRCIRFIQDRASQTSDHIRLAIIMMMRKFVEMTTYEFREAVRLYPQKDINDPVEAYVMQNFVQWRFGEKPLSLITWKNAFEQAGSGVGKWSTVETELPMNILKKTRKSNIQVSKSVFVNPERFEQKKREKMAKEEREKFKTLCGTSAALLKIDQLANIDY